MPANDPDALAAELFRTFARFEYALKAAEFHKGEGAAEANWRTFAESIAARFEEPASEEFAKAIAYMLAYPPKNRSSKVAFWDGARQCRRLIFSRTGC